VGIAGAAALRSLHDAIFANGGAWVIGATIAGIAALSLASFRRAHPAETRHASQLAPGGGRVG